MKLIPTLTLAVAAVVACTVSSDSHAQPVIPSINGNVNFSSGFLTFDSSLSQAHAITSYSNIVLGIGTGAYSGQSNVVVTWTPFMFNPSESTIKPLWSFSTNGVTYSFDATSVSLVFQNSGYLNLRGTGIAHCTGYADTPGTWTLAAQLTGSFYTFSATTMTTNGFVPKLTNVGQTNGTVNFSWNSVMGQGYQLQYATGVPATNWQNLGAPIVATGSTITTNDTPGAVAQRFYRVLLVD